MKTIKEEDGIQKQWYEEARTQTLDTLPAFLKKLTEDYKHDYGTICHAVAAAAVAAAWAVEKSPQGGITGFQAGAVMWEFMRAWNNVEAPAWLHKGEDMMFPQYHEKFTTISSETWEWLQKRAKKYLAEESRVVDERVVAHWQAIANGTVPFGLGVRAGHF